MIERKDQEQHGLRDSHMSHISKEISAQKPNKFEVGVHILTRMLKRRQ